MGPNPRRVRHFALAGLIGLSLTLCACIPDKPIDEPTPVGGRPSPTAAVPVAAGGATGTGSPVPGAAPAANQPVQGKVGEPVRARNWTLTVTSAEFASGRLILSVTLENGGATDILVQPSVELLVQHGPAADRTTAPPTLFGVPQPRLDGDLKRGAKNTGNVAYTVPADATNVTLTWKAPAQQDGAVLATIDLSTK